MRTCMLVIAITAISSNLWGQHQPSFESLVGDTKVGPVSTSGTVQLPYITWGGDVATFWANGGLTTQSGSIFNELGLNFKLTAGDDFKQQVRDYLSGKSPYLRGTIRMMGAASEVLNKDPRTKPVMFLQLTWSAGDHIVGREQIRKLNDLKGKKICLQEGGPHLGLLEDSLKGAGITWDDIEVVWTKDLTGPNGPAELFRKDMSIDAACVISPDMIGLCSGLELVGSGAEGTVKGAHVVNSTASMSRSIADVYVVRKDYFDANRDKVEAFVVGYLKATEQLLAAQKAYNNGQGKSVEYLSMLKIAQSVYGEEVLPTLEADAHGLVLDANFVRIPGNEIFFNDPNNLTGFGPKQTSALDLAVRLGYAKEKLGFAKADWDYKKISERVGVKYTQPVYAQGRIKAEVADFSEDLDSDTILSFEIQFEPEQISFPLETYAADFKRFCEASATFANAAIVIEGHADPTLALQHFFWAAKSKGLLTGDNGAYKFRGQPLELTDTQSVIQAVMSENLAGQKRRERNGSVVAVPDPRQTVAAALTLSQSRAEAVKQAIDRYAKSNEYMVDISQAIPRGVGIADPVNPRPRNMAQAKENMRVVFRVVRVSAEAITPDDFNFDE